MTVEANPAVYTICRNAVGGKLALWLNPGDSPTPPLPTKMH